MNPSARTLIEILGLEPLPAEGGFFRVTWRGETSSAILFLLTREAFSALHQLDRDELWHFHAGHPVEHVQLNPATGQARVARMGANPLAGEQPQVAVPAGSWQGARLDPVGDGSDDYALLGCTVSPAWDDHAFTLGDGNALARAFPPHAALIKALTR
jgi:hypothetical protein